MTQLVFASNTGWVIGFTLGIVVVLVVVVLVVAILLLAYRIGRQASVINDGLEKAVVNTAALGQLAITISSAEAIVLGLGRGRARLGG
jgi:hypothetical protein